MLRLVLPVLPALFMRLLHNTLTLTGKSHRAACQQAGYHMVDNFILTGIALFDDIWLPPEGSQFALLIEQYRISYQSWVPAVHIAPQIPLSNVT